MAILLHISHWRHLFFCPNIPPHLALTRDQLIHDIAQQAAVARPGTRDARLLMETYVLDFVWPNRTVDLLKRLLVFCKSLLHAYAIYSPEWESPRLATYPVRRARPYYRRAPHTETIPSDLQVLLPPYPG